MSYKAETQFDSPNVTIGRQGRKISAIVIHHWGDDGQSHTGVRNYLCRTNGGSSAHYVVSDGLVSCIVDPENTAWHAGDWEANLTTVGIECRPEMSDGDFETVATLIAELRSVYGDLPLRPHKQFMATACPGRWEAQLGRLSQRADAIRSSGIKAPTPAKPAPAPAPAPARASISQIAHRVIAGHYGNDPHRSNKLRAEGYNPAAVQAEVNRQLGAVPAAPPAPAVNIDALARAVIRGEYGNGAERTARLGVHAAAVQNRVNQILMG